MLDLNDVLIKYERDSRVQRIINQLKEPQISNVHIGGLCGSSDAFIANASAAALDSHQIFVLSNKDEAAYFFNNLENISANKNILFFPSSHKKPYEIEEVDNANVLLRAEVLNAILRFKKQLLIVTYPEAISEKVLTKKNLVQNTIEVGRGDKISIDFITDFLIDYEFENTDFVVEPGQFSVRGGIVDVFSFAHELPFRLEFFGDEIESIRSFNPIDQLSISKFDRISIIPNVQTKLLKESRESFLNFIPSQSIFWLKDLQSLSQIINAGIEKARNIYQTLSSEIAHLSPEDLYDTEDFFIKNLNQFSRIEFGSRAYAQNIDLSIHFNVSPQPSFNKNFKLLSENIAENNKKKFKSFIFSDTAKQIERLYSIFEDINKQNGIQEHTIDFSTVLISIHEGFIDHDLKLACYTDHQIFDRYHRFRLRENYSKSQSITLKELRDLNPGDFITHIDHGIGRYAGLEKIDVNGKQQEAIRLVYKDNDILYVSIHSLHRVSKYSGKDGTAPVLNKLGSNAWANLKQKTKKKVKDIARDLILLYAKRKSQKGFAFSPDTYMQNELEASFIYEDTPDQVKSTIDVKKDMEKPFPMDRLICGDVGFGKTEIAVRAAFKAVADSKQVGILVPTTILALQHYNTFKERLKDFPCKIDYINRFKSSKEQNETLKRLEEGKIDILIATHRLLGKDVKFKDIGLLIIDEEQKFGVAAKEKLKTFKTNVDTLTLTATPIPRTLQFSMMGARDLSIINTPPPNRYPVTTEIHPSSEIVIRDAITNEINRGGQVFFVHNRVQNIHEITNMVQKLCPSARIVVGHGQMDGEQLENALLGFVEGDFDVLVSTTIIEAGLDIPNANTIIINQAQNFGLSDLHQMRGRVGRSNKKAFCYLLIPPVSTLTNEARQRLKAIEEFSDLGSGFNISMRDLDIRGAGNLLGGEQSGFISEIGFEMYHKILDEAIIELKETDFKELFASENQEKEKQNERNAIFVEDCQVDTDMEILIPDEYVSNITERLNLYKELDNIENDDALQVFEKNLIDRFGLFPKQVAELLDAVRLRKMAKKLGFEKMVLKNNKMIGYFIANPSSAFYQSQTFTNILHFVQKNHSICKMKEDKNKLSLSFNFVDSVSKANNFLNALIKEQ